MVVGNMPEGVDFVVIGAGPGGYTAALEAANAGRDVVLVEASGTAAVGGVCLHEGCIPSKALIHLANAFSRQALDADMGLVRSAASVDMERFQEWKNGVVHTLGNGVRTALSRAGVTIVTGQASFIDAATIRVLQQDAPSKIFNFRDLIIATGSQAVELPMLDKADSRVMDAADVLDLTQIPDHVVVIGAGYIGVELGTALAKLGSSVTILEAQSRILPGIVETAAREVERHLGKIGVSLLVNTVVTGLDGNGVTAEQDGNAATVPADAVIVAVGRRPATDGLALEKAHIGLTDRRHIKVDSRLRCADNICAIGDVIPGPGLAHRATAEARIAVENLCGGNVVVDHLVPEVVFSDPEIATVGWDLDHAQRDRSTAVSTTTPLAFAGRALVEQAPRGFASIVYDTDSRELLGATIVGANATELIAQMTIAIESGLSVDDIALTIHPHPTISEIWWETAQRAAGSPIGN